MKTRDAMTTIGRSRGSTLLLLLCGLVLGSVSAGPAAAQFRDNRLPPGEIVAALRQRGFVAIARPRLDGTTYRLEATNRRGERVGLVVDAYDAEILERSFGEDSILPPRDIGTGAPRPAPPPIMERNGGFGARALEDLPEEADDPADEADLADLPPVPAPIYREALPVPQDIRPLAPAAPSVLPEPERLGPTTRSNPLALPPRQEPAPAPAPAARAVPPVRIDQPRPSDAGSATKAKVEPPKAEASKGEAPKGEAKSASSEPPPRGKVRIIGGVAPVLPRDPAEPAKPN